MTYEVLITPRAEWQLNAIADWIAKNAPKAADRWFNRFVDALLTLAEHPRRCSIAPESESFPYEVRQLLFGRRRNYRALFTIHADSVVILSIRHAAQDEADAWEM